MPRKGPVKARFIPHPEIVRIKSILRSRVMTAGIGAFSNRCVKARASLHLLEAILDELQFYSRSLSDVGYLFDLEASHCSGNFKTVTGKSFCEWRRGLRVRAAMKLLRETSLSITEIATRVGHAEMTRFDKNFLLEVGMCPGQYRRLHAVSLKLDARPPGRREAQAAAIVG